MVDFTPAFPSARPPVDWALDRAQPAADGDAGPDTFAAEAEPAPTEQSLARKAINIAAGGAAGALAGATAELVPSVLLAHAKTLASAITSRMTAAISAASARTSTICFQLSAR